MSMSTTLAARRTVALATFALAASTGIAIAGGAAASAAVCTATANGHDAAVVIVGSGSVTGQTVDASGCYYGVYVAPGATATVSGNSISGYYKAGVFVDGTGTTAANATILNNEVDGTGNTDQVAQNGIEFWGQNSSGVVRGNTIDGHSYTGSGWTATGLLLFDVNAKQVKTSNNKFLNNQKNMALVTATSCASQYNGFYGDAGLC